MNVYWKGLGRLDIAGKGKGRAGENGVSFVTGADIDRFSTLALRWCLGYNRCKHITSGVGVQKGSGRQ